MNKQFFGEDGFHFFIGVVEDILDPEKLGRVKVRAFGLHTQDLNLIPTKDLPWAICVSSIETANIDGIGVAPVGLLRGSVVFGFWMDGESMQHPAVLGSIPGIPITMPNGKVGFNDPEECYPFDLETPDVNIAARGVKTNYKGVHKATEWRTSNVIGGATCDGGWQEPPSPSMPIYPNNSVREFKFKMCEGEDYGHIEEFDSTPGAERYLRHHKTSNNFIESHPDGTEVRKIHGPHFELNLDDKTLLVKGDWKIEVEGNKTEYIHGDYCLLIDGHYSQTVGEYKDVDIGTYFSETIGLYKDITIGAYRKELIGGFSDHTIGVYESHKIGAYKTEVIGGYRDIKIGTQDTLDVGDTRDTIIGAQDTLVVLDDRIEDITGKLELTSNALLENISTIARTTAATSITFESAIIISIGDISLEGPVSAHDATLHSEILDSDYVLPVVSL